MRNKTLSVLAVLGIAAAVYAEEPSDGMKAHYMVLSGKTGAPPPFATVDVLTGPTDSNGTWWQLEARAKDEPRSLPLFQLQVLTSRHPLIQSEKPLEIRRYILRIPDTEEVLEYRNVHTKMPLLPTWGDFVNLFFPHPIETSPTDQGMAKTCAYLGHVLTMHAVKASKDWAEMKPTKVLDLDPELLIGTSRSFKDKEGHRLPPSTQPVDYKYVPFVEADYRVMIDTGINLYVVQPDQEKFVRDEPVFYVRWGGDPRPRFPTDFYRSNLIGGPMFMDEPASIMSGDMTAMHQVRSSLDCFAVLQRRVKEQYDNEIYELEHELKQGGVNFGAMRLTQTELPVWETVYDSTFCQMSGGGSGIIHEARYQLGEFDKWVAERAGVQRKHSVDELLRYHYAFMRGGTRPFGKYWGTSIYGQCDPKIAPRALEVAYDMGARYLWYWTSDHEHHMPWPEQLELTKSIRKYAAEHPRPSIFGPQPKVDLAIVIPYGTFPSVWSAFDIGDRTMLKKVQPLINQAFDDKSDFDVVVDDGRKITGYKRIERITK